MMRLRHTLFIVAVLASSFLAPNYAAAYLTWADMHPCGGTQPPASPINVVSRGMDQIQLYNEPGSWNTVLRDSVDLGVFMDDFTDTYNLVPNTTYTYQLGVKDTNPTSPTYGNILSTSNPVSVTTLSANSTPTPTDPAIELPVGAVGKSYTFYATAYPDPDGQQVKVRFDWGDGATSDTACFTPATGGTVVNRSHTWSAVGYYGVKAAEVDSVGRWSSWTTALGYGGTGSMSIGRGDDVTLPTTPGNFSATAIAVSPTRIDLKWDLSTDNYSVKGYRIYRNGVLLNDFASTYSLNKYYLADTAWYYSDYGLPPSTLYTYKIDAIDPSGNISTQSLPAIATTYSAPDATAPTVPTGISTLSANLNQAVIEWNDSTDNIGVAGYKIYRNDTSIGQSIIYDSPSTDPRGSADYTMITSSLPTRYIDYGPSGGFVAGTTYTYKVAAYDAAYNTSAQSASVSATPGIADTTAPTTPAGLSATAVSSSQINLSWTASTDAVGVTGYSIYRNGGTTPLATVTGTSYSDTELSPATSYSYVVKAADAAGNLSSSSASASATTESAQVLADTTAPTTPAGLSATAVSSSQINLSWTASTDAVGVTGYKIYRNGGTTPLATVTTTSYSNTGLSADTSYSYTVKATDVAGNLSLSSASANATTETASVLADTTLPTVPIGLSATAVSSSQINLSWTASTDTVSVTGYKIYRNGGTTPLATVTETSYSNTGLSAGTNYSYTVKAVDAAGNLSLSSASANATTLAVVIVDTQAPTIPTGLVATKNVYNEVDLSWTASTDNIGVTGYYIFRRANALWTMLGQSTNRAYVDTTVMPSTAYSFAVKAYDAGGNISGTSTVLSLNTPAAQIVSVTNPTTTTVTTKNTIEEPLTQTFKPYIVLNGDAVVHVPYGGTYSEAGAKGYLVLDGTAVAPKRLLGGLDATKPGSYTVTYQLLDSSGGVIASITRTVIVDPPLTVSSVELITTQTQYANYCDDPKHETECQSYASQKVISSTVTSHGTGITEEQFSSVSPTEVFQAATLAVPITDAKQLNAVCAQAEYVGACTNSLVAQGVLSKKEAESQVKQVLKKSEEVTKIFTERIGARSFEDTDQDGITNYDEVNIYRTDPKKADTNKDGVSDGEQLLLGEDPLAKKQTPPGATSTVPVIIIPEKKVAYEDPRFAGNTKKEIFVAPTIKTTPVLLPAGAATTTPTTKTTLEGRALPNSFVTIYIFSEPIVVTIKTDSAGAWTYTLDKELPDGTHEMYSAITDSGGRILAKSSPLPFVKEAAAAVSLGSTVLVPPINETPPGFFSGTSLYVLIVIIIGILGLAVAIMGYVANRNKGGSDVPPATLPPPTQ